MSDTISMIYRDYEDYEFLCKKLMVEPIRLSVNGDWYKHFLELNKKERNKNE